MGTYRHAYKSLNVEFKSINPYNGQEIAVYKENSETEILHALHHSQDAFFKWRKVSVEERSALMKNAAKILLENVEENA